MWLPTPSSSVVTARVTDRVSSVAVGWNDEMQVLSAWSPLGIQNRPQVWRTEEGTLALRLPQVPDGWPYAYQWSGLSREAIVDLGRYPVLLAKVETIAPGYAHLEIEEHDVEGKVVRSRRTPTLTSAGMIQFDLGDEAKNVRRLTLRLIVGGPNEGAMVAYRWVRFTSRDGADAIERNPKVRVRVLP